MSNIYIKNLTFGFDLQGVLLFDQTNLRIQTSWKLGLVGRNGRGKTTLLRLLQGKYPYTGSIEHQVKFWYFPQTITDKAQPTYQVIEGFTETEYWKIERELNLLKLDTELLWQPFNQLSGGEQTKVLLAILFAQENGFALIDEPTNHLDLPSRQLVANYLKGKKEGFILVSHDRQFVDEIVDHTLAIERNQLVLHQGNYSQYEQEKLQQDAMEQAQNRKLKREINRLHQTAREKAQWSNVREKDKYGNPHQKGSGAIYDTGAIGARAARVMKRSKTIVQRVEKQLEEKERLLKNIEKIDELKIIPLATHKKQWLKVEKFQLFYDKKPLFQPISFELNPGDRLAVIGENGSGKTSLLNYFLGNFKGEVQGEITIDRQWQLSYVRQNFEENTGTIATFCQKNKINEEQFLNQIRKLGVERHVFNNKIEHMSQGQQKRIEIAKALVTPANIFIWDEPLNYLDAFNYKQLEQTILKTQPTMIVIDHDSHFLTKIATKVIELKK
ncbi:ribosomal protection-like ABC-F family protein [Enterococcus lemanii]|uniref:Ribosomal protection-like ABC-F family protein n=1 Tax=Enterococcus lemanii TaxID=1159752 RepID=A0ABV9MZ70_9ENTE|nr:ABC-F type ribosomal protection protein [Enterococcus lemanii]MBM7709680.1 lincosamide and streptogramin A transport system ATP-binding/permease protein [Enterococcus lemanii]